MASVSAVLPASACSLLTAVHIAALNKGESMSAVRFLLSSFLLTSISCLYASLEMPFGGGGLGMGGGDTAFDLGPEGEEPTEIPATSYVADPFGQDTTGENGPGGSMFNFSGGGFGGGSNGYSPEEYDDSDDAAVHTHPTNPNAPGYHAHHSFYDEPEKEEVYVQHAVSYYDKKKQDPKEQGQEEKENQDQED